MRRERELTYFYITHDLCVAESVCDSIAVMYLGKVVEVGNSIEVFRAPRHPYSQALIVSTPIADPERKRDRIILPGEVPSPVNPPSGCRFHPRCRYARSECPEEEPALVEVESGHQVACHLFA
ncbi:ABC transporter ATP-binding protein [Dehalococcoidia bacterium]|nr:ABC transporter ATP-binding protein [Dehalococcoidia bacterium]MCL0089470.1 ABC transporter ATP-binding protein [Dehalococcoidia bacterium]